MPNSYKQVFLLEAISKLKVYLRIYNKRWSATRRTRRASAIAAGAPARSERNHNFRRFRSFLILAHLSRLSLIYAIVQSKEIYDPKIDNIH